VRAFAVHDRNGNIASLVICPPDGPALFPSTGPGQLVSEVDLPDDAFHFGDEERALRVLRDFLVDFQMEARLVRR